MVYGVGVNDYTYPVTVHRGDKKVVWVCPIYSAWKSMLKRCYSEPYQSNNQTYKDCFVVDEWLSFSNFREWFIQRYRTGYTLDKDLLFDGNKKYGPDTCVVVPGYINRFVIYSKRKKTNYPIGVSLYKKTGKYMGSVNIDGKIKNLGYFDTPEEAHNAWKSAKLEILLRIKGVLDSIDDRLYDNLKRRYE